MAPHVQGQLAKGYDRALEETGPGSVARQKVRTAEFDKVLSTSLTLYQFQAVFHNFVAQNKDDMFGDGADVLMDRLTKAAEAVGEALDEALAGLAQKVFHQLALV